MVSPFSSAAVRGTTFGPGVWETALKQKKLPLPVLARNPLLKMTDSAVRAEETAKGGIKYELVLSEPSANDPPRKEAITSPPKAMSVEEIEQKLKAAEERRLMLEAERLNQINEKKNKLQEANQKRQEYNNNFIQSTKETLEQKMGTFESNREAKLRALQEKLKEHERHVEEVRLSKNLGSSDTAPNEGTLASSG